MIARDLLNRIPGLRKTEVDALDVIAGLLSGGALEFGADLAHAGRKAARECSEIGYYARSVVLNRVATAEMRHAAMLMGIDSVLQGTEAGPLLEPLAEFSQGIELGVKLRKGRAADLPEGVPDLAVYRTRLAGKSADGGQSVVQPALVPAHDGGAR